MIHHRPRWIEARRFGIGPWGTGFSYYTSAFGHATSIERFSIQATQTQTAVITSVQDVTSVDTATVVATITIGGANDQVTQTMILTATRTGDALTQTDTKTKAVGSTAGVSTSRARADESHSVSPSATSAADHVPTTASVPTTAVFVTLSDDGRTVTLRGSDSTAHPAATGASGGAASRSGAMEKGDVAAIVLALALVLGLSGLLLFVWRKRRASKGREVAITQFVPPASASASSVIQVPSRRPSYRSTPIPWDASTDVAQSAAATVVSPAGASGYHGGRAVYPLEEKTRLGPSATRYRAPHSPTTFVTTPSSPSAHPLLSPLSPNPVSPPPAIHTQLTSARTDLPYAWDQPPPSSEYLPLRHSTLIPSAFVVASGSLARESYRTMVSTPPYSHGGLDVHGRPPSYSPRLAEQ
ncbi:hypothetical protein DICSQDRAFT_183454 [Dichomitus squalens LYAD-421 SS1]|uniref:Uncharacterized protein n=1 Tax=Dichomitus squalens (strain LYAD-421) TaxID=732165 RepID=R7SQ01_DICSQ|nr:uncharacterized protein DICSQDRAFT_183454 [Dichomitus squalens LYAD-421 SS1]EJF57057.1 hypothetical protein DICSQDRAFT_183454 [Dichomitus squalens LYAD-421 SS1]